MDNWWPWALVIVGGIILLVKFYFWEKEKFVDRLTRKQKDNSNGA